MMSGFCLPISSTQWIRVSSMSKTIVFLLVVFENSGRSTIKLASSSIGGAVTPQLLMLTRFWIVCAKCCRWSWGVSGPYASSGSSVCSSSYYSGSVVDSSSDWEFTSASSKFWFYSSLSPSAGGNSSYITSRLVDIYNSVTPDWSESSLSRFVCYPFSLLGRNTVNLADSGSSESLLVMVFGI